MKWLISLISVAVIIIIGVKWFLPKNMQLTSVFDEGEKISVKYTCDGDNLNPELKFSGVPAGAKSLALIVDDPDAPSGVFTHWLVWNIKPDTAAIDENSVPAGAVLGKNDAGSNRYLGPCPPSGTHHYRFKIYALDTVLDLAGSAEKADLEKAMDGHILDQGLLTGVYSK